MTDLTDEAVKAMLAHYDLPTDCDCDGDDCVKCSHYPTFQERASKQLKDAAPDLARALLDARAELAQARAEAQAAVARGMERAAEILAVRADVLLVDAGADAELVRVLDASVAAIRTAATSLRTGEAG